MISIHALREEGDGRAYGAPHRGAISIHALREEGDYLPTYERDGATEFLSTPSARRATLHVKPSKMRTSISIHALREEGDAQGNELRRLRAISIHALREEGDTSVSIR